MTVSASAHIMVQAVSAPLPILGGEIDLCPLRWCILTGTDCLACAELYRVNSSDAEVAILTRRPYRRPLSSYTSVCLQYWTRFGCSQVRLSGRLCTLLYAPLQLISLHVFEDDTVAKVTVSKANQNVFLFLVLVGPCPVPCCFAVLLCGETQIWLGDLRVVLGCGFVLFVLFLVMICHSFWTTRVLYTTAFHCLRNCKDRA